MTSTHVTLFGTFSLAATDTTSDVLFAGGDGVGVGQHATRRTSPPLAGIVRRVTLRMISGVADPSGLDYFVKLFGTRLNPAVAINNASYAASFIGRSLAPLTPTALNLALLTFDEPDLDQVVDWPYNLSPLATGPGGDLGADPASVPGLLARLTIAAVPGGASLIIGIGIEIESRVPGFPTAPRFQRGGDVGGVAWPLITTP